MNKIITVLAASMTALAGFLNFNAAASPQKTQISLCSLFPIPFMMYGICRIFCLSNLQKKPYDLDNDGVWSVFDLCLMKREVQENMNTDTNSDTLVIYFSRTGNTEKIAEYLIDLTGADSYVIEAAVPYTDDDIKYQTDCHANKEQNDKTVRPEIANPIASIDSYDTIFLG